MGKLNGSQYGFIKSRVQMNPIFLWNFFQFDIILDAGHACLVNSRFMSCSNTIKVHKIQLTGGQYGSTENRKVLKRVTK